MVFQRVLSVTFETRAPSIANFLLISTFKVVDGDNFGPPELAKASSGEMSWSEMKELYIYCKFSVWQFLHKEFINFEKEECPLNRLFYG